MIHFAKISYLFHDIRFSSPFPILNFDFLIYFARLLRADKFLSISGRTWGYDPYQMGGYVSGVIDGAGTNFVAWIMHFFSEMVPLHTSLLIVEFLGFLSMPFIVFGIVKNFGGKGDQAWIGFGVFVVMYGLLDYSFQWLRIITVGLFWYSIAALISVLQVSLCYKWMISHSKKTLLWLAITSALVLRIHPLSIPIILIPNLLLYLLFFKNMNFKEHLLTLGALGIAFIFNMEWINGVVSFSNWKSINPLYQYSGGWQELFHHFSPIKTSIFQSTIVFSHLFLFWFFVIQLRDFENRKFSWIIILWGFTLFVFGYFGSEIPYINSLQPRRFIFPFWLLVFCMSSLSLGKYLRIDSNRKKIFSILIVIGLFFGVDDWLSEKQRGFFTNKLGAEEVRIIDFLKTIDPSEGRILFEMHESSSLEKDKLFSLYDIVPYLTGHSLVGGPNPGNFLTSRFSDFLGVYWHIKDPILFGEKLYSLDVVTINQYLIQYNTNLILSRSKKSIAFFDSEKKHFTRIGDVPPYKIYKFKKENTWFLKGSGDLSFD